MAKQIKAILWDNDGVLVDTEKLYFQANLEILASIGIKLDQESYRQNFLVQSQGLINILKSYNYSDNKIKELRSARNEIYSDYLRSGNSLICGVEETLSELHGKFRMGIVTGSRKDHFNIIHSNTNIFKYMDFVVAQGDYLNSKPHSDPYLEGVKRMGLSSKECLAIEDTERGLISAKNAGLKCWVIPHQQSINSDFSKADKILSNILEVIPNLE